MSTCEPVKLRLLRPAAAMPARGSARSAGYDLFASEPTTLPASTIGPDGGLTIGRALVPTGIALAIPDGVYGRVAPRSGLAVRHGIDVGAGVIDSDYREELKVLLFNFTGTQFEIAAGDRIAQLVFERVAEPEFLVVDELDQTSRSGGFGSTGIR